MKNMRLKLLAIGISSLILFSGNAWAVHYLNHYQGQNTQEPTAAQITTFCQGYSNLKADVQLKQKTQYEKYCKKTLAKPVIKKPVITRLANKGKCVAAKGEVQILGRNFGKKGTVLLQLNGKKTVQKVRRWTDTDIRVMLDRNARPGNRYSLTVKNAAGISNSRFLQLCKEKPPVATFRKPAPGNKQLELKPLAKQPTGKTGIGQAVSFGKADLVVTITGPKMATAGVVIPGLRVQAKNIGKVQASGYKIDLILSKQNLTPYLLGLKSKTGNLLLQSISLTTPLAPNGRKDYFPNKRLPANTAAGKYYLCAIIDSANKLNEYKVNNNTQCKQIQVATASQGVAVKGQLGSKLRDNIGNKPKPIQGFKPTLLKKPIQPANIQTIGLYINSLTINGSLLPTVDVAEGGSAQVAWSFPADSGVDWTYLRIKEGTFSGSCPTGVSNRVGRTDLEGRDTGWEAFPDRQNYRVGMGDVAIDLGAGRGFVAGRSYSIQACGLVPPPGGAGREYTHESNVVVLRYADAPTMMPEPTPERTIEAVLEPVPGTIPGTIPELPPTSSRLTVNSDPWGQNLDVGTAANVRWSFRNGLLGDREAGVETEVRKVYLRIVRGYVGVRNLNSGISRGLCPAPGVSLEAGLAQLNEWDSRYLDLPGRGFYDLSTVSGTGSIAITPGGEYDLNQYTPSRGANRRDYELTFVACGLIQPEGGSGGFVFAQETNPVWMGMVDIPRVPRLVFSRSPYDLTIEDMVKTGKKTLIVAKATLPAGYTWPDGTTEWDKRLPTVGAGLWDSSDRAEALGGTQTVDFSKWAKISENVWKVWLLSDYSVPVGFRQKLLAELRTFNFRDRNTVNNWMEKTLGSGPVYRKPPVVRNTTFNPPGGPPKFKSQLKDFRETLRAENRLDFEFVYNERGRSKELRIEVELNPLAKMVCKRSSATNYVSTMRVINNYGFGRHRDTPYRISCVKQRFSAAGSGEGRIFIRAFDRVRDYRANINSPVDEIVVDFNVTRPSP